MERFIRLLAHELGFDLMIVTTKPDYIDLRVMSLPSPLRGQGVGSEFMRRVCEQADDLGVILGTCPEPLEPGWTSADKERLIAWYRRFGFVENADEDRYHVSYVRFPHRSRLHQ